MEDIRYGSAVRRRSIGLVGLLAVLGALAGCGCPEETDVGDTPVAQPQLPRDWEGFPCLTNVVMGECSAGETPLFVDAGGAKQCLKPGGPESCLDDDAVHPIVLPQWTADEGLAAFRARVRDGGADQVLQGSPNVKVHVYVLDDSHRHGDIVEWIIRDVACGGGSMDCVTVHRIDATFEGKVPTGVDLMATAAGAGGAPVAAPLYADPNNIRVGSPATMAWALDQVREQMAEAEAEADSVHLINLSMAWHPGVSGDATDLSSGRDDHDPHQALLAQPNEIGAAYRAIDAVLDKGAVFFSAAGNFTPGPPKVRQGMLYPAAWTGLIRDNRIAGSPISPFVAVDGANFQGRGEFSLTREDVNPNVRVLAEEGVASVNGVATGPMTGTSVATAVATGMAARAILVDSLAGGGDSTLQLLDGRFGGFDGDVVDPCLDCEKSRPKPPPNPTATVLPTTESASPSLCDGGKVWSTGSVPPGKLDVCPELEAVGTGFAGAALLMNTQPKGDVVSCDVCRFGLIQTTPTYKLELQVEGFDLGEAPLGTEVLGFSLSVNSSAGSHSLQGGSGAPNGRTWDLQTNQPPNLEIYSAKLLVLIEFPDDSQMVDVVPLTIF